MIDIFINIDSWQWEWWMKKIRPYTALRMWEWWFIIRMQEDLMNLDNIEKYDQKSWTRSVKHEYYNKQLTKSHTQQAETCECYNYDKSEHLVRDCKKPQWQRKEVTMMNSVIMHD